MKKLLFLSMLLPAMCLAQTEVITKVPCNEYGTPYITNLGKVYLTLWNGSAFVLTDLGMSNIVDGDGGQYSTLLKNTSGQIYSVFNDGTITAITTEATGRSITGVQKIYGCWQGYFYLRNDSIFAGGRDTLHINGGAVINQPIKLGQPAGRHITKLVPLTLSGITVVALCSDSTVWKYVYGSSTPVQIGSITNARDIAGIGSAAIVIETSNDLLAFGYLASYLGLTDGLSTPTSIKAQFTAAGAVFPSLQITGTYNCFFLIDQQHNLFVRGDAANGDAGTGNEMPLYRTYFNGSSSAPWHYDFGHGQRIIPVTQVPGKFKNLCTGYTYCFYCYAQDMGDNWYSWGRNKSRSLGNGLTLNSNDEGSYPNGLDVPAPRLVTPLTQSWTIVGGGSHYGPSTFNINSAKAPLANAGINQYNITTNTTTLYGSGSSQQEFSITTYAWSQISGPSCTIVSPSAVNTSVTSLITGTYVFRLTVTNSNSVTNSRDVTVVVTLPTSSGCQAPQRNQIIPSIQIGNIVTSGSIAANAIQSNELMGSKDGTNFFRIGIHYFLFSPATVTDNSSYPISSIPALTGYHGGFFLQQTVVNGGCPFKSSIVRVVIK